MGYVKASCTAILLLLTITAVRAQTDLNQPIRGICIYIDYPDAPQNVSSARVDSLLNDMDYQESGVNRSFRKYWRQETRRNFDIQHDIFYYTAPMPSTFYAGLIWTDGIELWKDALEWVIANHPTYDWNSLSKWSTADPYNSERPAFLAGAIKSAMVISSTYGPTGLGAAHTPQWLLSNGATVGTIQGSGLQRTSDPTINLFVLIHETGHSLFNLPDTYDYDASSGGTAKYSVMSAQGPDVEPVGAPFIYQHGWGYIKEPAIGTHTYVLPADGDTIVVLKNTHDPKEFFALEVRRDSTPGNSLFPAPIGLLIWHSDLKVNTSNRLENRSRYEHYQHSVVQKDGLFELENGGPVPPINSGDVYLPGNEFSDITTPNTKWWAGEASDIEVKDILILDDNHVQFTVVVPEVHEVHYNWIPKDDWSIVSETAAQAGFDGSNAIDDDLSTYYHVEWGSSEPRPHELVIDLGADYELTELYYTANDNFSPPWEGRIKDYEVYFSEDGIDWGTPAVAGQFFQTEYRQYELLTAEVARYVKFSALNSYLDDERTSIAEIDFRGRLFSATALDEDNSSSLDAIEFTPNPVVDFLKIVGPVNDYTAGEFTIVISSPLGVVAEVKNYNSSALIDMSSYSSGWWVVSLYDNTDRLLKSEKILLMR